MIPRILHQIWVGGDPFPPEFQAYQDTWREHHPSWELRFWTEDNLPANLRHPEAYELDRLPVERSDIMRLDILWQQGGVYVDTDFECRRPIDELLDGVELCAAELKAGSRTNNAFIGAAPGHPILARALEQLRILGPGEPFDKTASSSLFFDSMISGQPGVTVFPFSHFYPTTPAQRESAYAVHHAARSWKDGEGWRAAALRAEQRLDKASGALEKETAAHAKTKRTLERLREELGVLKAENKRLSKGAGADQHVAPARRKFTLRRD